MSSLNADEVSFLKGATYLLGILFAFIMFALIVVVVIATLVGGR